MKIEKEVQDFIKTHRGMLSKIVNERMQDYFNKVVDEPDPARKEVLSLLVKEFRMALLAIDNLSKQKEITKSEEEFTGV